MSGLFLYCEIVRFFCLVSFFELTFPDSQGWLSVKELTSCGLGGNQEEAGAGKGMRVYVCVKREALCRIALPALSQAPFGMGGNADYYW
jgi:hypothetical protein